MIFEVAAFSALLTISQSGSTTLVCTVDRKVDAVRTYSDENLTTYQSKAIIVLGENIATVSRCSISVSQGGTEACDTYDVDYSEFDQNTEVSKFYYFRGQFDIQVFKNGAFVENNGRGTISFGVCR